jgi:hypothetical protein
MSKRLILLGFVIIPWEVPAVLLLATLIELL